MNIFLIEMKAYRKSLIIWCIGVFLMVASGMVKYVSYSSTGQTMNDIMAQMPKAVRAIIGAGSFDLTKASGYYGLLFLYLVLMATIHAVLLGANIIAKEERDKTTEFLMVKPVSRNKIITAKLSAALTNIIIFNLVTLISSIIMVNKYSHGEAVGSDISILMAGMFMLQLMFLFIGAAIAASYKNSKKATAIAATIMMVTFILSIVIDINDKLDILKYLTPFKYFDAKNLMSSGFDPLFVTLSVVIMAILLAVTYVFYQKRDLNV